MRWVVMVVRYGPPVGAILLLFGTVLRGPAWLPDLFSFRRVVRSNREYSARMRAAGDVAAARRAEARLADHLERMQRCGALLSAVGGVVLVASLLVTLLNGGY